MNELRRSKHTAFQHNGEAVLGNHRNCLLVKDDVGRAKPFTHRLPGNEFAFGKISQFTESAGEGKFSQQDVSELLTVAYL